MSIRLIFCLLLTIATGLAPGSVVAASAVQAASPPTLDQRIDAAVRPVADAISGAIFHSVRVGGTDEVPLMFPLIVGWLILAGLVFTFYFRFINVRGFVHGFHLISGRYSDPAAPGEVSHFQALTSAVSGLVRPGRSCHANAALAWLRTAPSPQASTAAISSDQGDRTGPTQ